MIEDRDIDKRLVDLETKHSFHEAALIDLNAVIVEQTARIESLEAVVKLLRDKVKELAGEGQGPLPQGERPPHY